MEISVEAAYGGIVINLKKFLVKEGENKISFNGPQNSIYAFDYTVGEVNGSNRGKSVIGVSTG